MKQWILLLSLALLAGCNKPKHLSNQASQAICAPGSIYTVKVLRHEKNYFADWGEIDGKEFENRYDAVVCEVLNGKKHVCDLAVYQHWFKKNRKDYPVVGSEITIKQFDFKEQMFNPVPGLYTIELDDFDVLKSAPATK